MRILRDVSALPPAVLQGAIAIGNFDGVHRGHARIVERLIAKARALHGPAVVFTFDPHPVRLLRPEAAPPPLTWTERKAELLVDLGVDWMVAYPTDEALLQLSPEEFFEQIVESKLAARALVEGPNFYFGRDRSGDIGRLAELADAAGIDLEIVEPYRLDGDVVSSSRTRRLIAAGDVGTAAKMLTRPYRIRGMVTHGARRGARIGFPTANIDAIDTLLPGLGVYAGLAHTGGQRRPAAINVGPSPTFGDDALKVEVHLIGFSGNLYGQAVEVDFLARLRDIEPFGSVEQLQAQLRRDVAQTQEIAERFDAPGQT